MSFFESESAFDDHKIQRMRSQCGEAAARALESLIKPLRGQYSEKFALTRADLHSHNIHVRQVKDAKGESTSELSAILDWGRSGFYLEYMEYAMAI
jgi:hypothetical protein